jgi:hypothetical membrane protein
MDYTFDDGRVESQRDFFVKYAVVQALIVVPVGIFLILYGSTLYPNFNWISRTISNMGNPTRGVGYNSASLVDGAYVIAGLGTIPLFVHYARIFNHSTHRGLRVGGKLIVLAAIDIGFLGIASENFDVLHIAVSNLFFLLIALSILCIGLGWWRMPGERRWAILNFIVLFVAVGQWLVYFTIFQGTSVNQALFEFATVIEFGIIIITYSFKAYKLGLKI